MTKSLCYSSENVPLTGLLILIRICISKSNCLSHKNSLVACEAAIYSASVDDKADPIWLSYIDCKATKNKRNSNELFSVLISYLRVFEVADYESEVRIRKFIDPIWRIQYSGSFIRGYM